MKPDNMISSLKRPLPRTARRRPLARRSRIRERAIHRHWGDCWRIIDPNLEKREPCKPRLGMRPRLHCEEMAFQRDNHYVSCLYLKRFAASPGRVWTYRTLVAHSRVPVWKLAAIKGVAYRAHLYTRLAAGVPTDEIERWLNADFETPAEEALMKATADMRLSPTDWHNLVRFLAAQDVRTPARLAENLQRWKDSPRNARRNSSRFGASVRLGEKVWSGDQADNGCPQRLHTLAYNHSDTTRPRVRKGEG